MSFYVTLIHSPPFKVCSSSASEQTFPWHALISVSQSPVSRQKPPFWRFPRFHFPQTIRKVMSCAWTYIFSKFHSGCEPYLMTGALIGFNRANYLGPGSLRGCVSVMDFICILNSYVWPVGTGPLHRHLSLSKHMDISSEPIRTHTHTHTHTHADVEWLNKGKVSIQSNLTLEVPEFHSHRSCRESSLWPLRFELCQHSW